MDYEDNLPPVIRLLLNEPSLRQTHTVPSRTFNALQRLMPELRRQADWTFGHFNYDQSLSKQPFGTFVALPTAAADPLTLYGACLWIECRVNAALNFCRTLGLYADTIILPDTFTPRLAFQSKFSQDDYMYFMTDILVLLLLEPLIRAGVVRFRLPLTTFCEVHHKQFQEEVAAVASELLPQYTENVEVEVSPNSLFIKPNYVGNSIGLSVSLTARMRKDMAKASSPLAFAKQLYERSLLRQIDEMLTEHVYAVHLGATVVSTSRLHMLTVLSAERRMPNMRHLDVWEDKRSAELPWIRDLSPAQVVYLREEAVDALPRFRETVGEVMSKPSDDTDKRTKEVVRALRAEAAEVKGELAKLRKSNSSILKNVATTSLGLAMTLYGLATGAAAKSSMLLLGLLGLIHADSASEHKRRNELRAKPGYVLVKAETLTGHSHQ